MVYGTSMLINNKRNKNRYFNQTCYLPHRYLMSWPLAGISSACAGHSYSQVSGPYRKDEVACGFGMFVHKSKLTLKLYIKIFYYFSGVLSMFWFLSALCGGLTFASVIAHSPTLDGHIFAFAVARYSAVLAMAFLTFWEGIGIVRSCRISFVQD